MCLYIKLHLHTLLFQICALVGLLHLGYKHQKMQSNKWIYKVRQMQSTNNVNHFLVYLQVPNPNLIHLAKFYSNSLTKITTTFSYKISILFSINITWTWNRILGFFRLLICIIYRRKETNYNCIC